MRLSENDPVGDLMELQGLFHSYRKDVERIRNKLRPHSVRKLSLAITNFEQGELWLERAIQNLRDHLSDGTDEESEE